MHQKRNSYHIHSVQQVFIRKAVEDPAAERLIDGTLASGATLTVDADADGEVVLK